MTTTWSQHTRQQHNIVAAQNMEQTLLGTENSTIGKKVETTIHDAKQPQLSVRVSMIDSLNEEIEINLSSFSVLLQLVPVARCSELKRRATQGCVGFGDL